MTWSSGSGIYEGFWTDWSRGSIRGKTLTLGPTNSIILTNSLAMFVTLCSIQMWAIVRYLLHLSGPPSQRDASSPRGAQQLILRNTSSALTTALVTIELIWDNRKQTWRTLLRPYTIVVWAAIYAALFTAAGVFSNKAVSAATNNGASLVLMRSKACGDYNQTYFNMIWNRAEKTIEDFDMSTEFYAKRSREAQRSVQYVQQCYLPDASEMDMSSACRVLKNPIVGNVTGTLGECPFAKKSICHDESSVVTFETGKIDSHENLGINSRPEDRLTYSRISTCSVLNDTSRITGWAGDLVNASAPPPQKQSAYAFYGPNSGLSTNWTYSISNFASYYDAQTARVTIPYQLDVEYTPALTDPQWSGSDFDPIPEIAQSSADLILIFLSFSGMYLEEIDDPWFSAHQPHTFTTPNNLYKTRYSRDRAISTIGCTEKHNMCTANNTCTGFLGFDQFQNVADFNSILNPHQNITFDRMTKAIEQSSIWNAIQQMSQTTRPLMATSQIQVGTSGAVISATMPNDQWKRELQFWQSISLAQLQRQTMLWATGEIAPDPMYLVPAKDEKDVWFCDNFMVPSNVYQSFSVLAVANIIVFGTILIAAGMFIDDVADCVASWLHRKSPGTSWKNDNMLTLHLQRRRTRGRRRSFFSYRSKSHYTASPQVDNNTPPMPAIPTPVINSVRVSSQAWPLADRYTFLSPNPYTSPNLHASSTLHASPVLHVSAEAQGRQHSPAFAPYHNFYLPAERQISIHEMNSLPSKTPIIHVDDSYCKFPETFEESAPENYYRHQPHNGSPVSKVSQVLDWIRTLHPEQPAFPPGTQRSEDLHIH